MIKSLSTFVLLILCSYVLNSQDAISLNMTVPFDVVAGQEFLVSIDIEKGKLEEFSRFQQELPAGFTAIQENSGSADFSFDNQRVRFIWLKLPAEESLNISYKVKVHERLKGTLSLFGEFSYVENNERRSIVIDKKVINVSPSPDIAADQQVEIADFASVLAREKAVMSSSIKVSCIRQTPYLSRTGNDIMVNMLVYKKDMNKFAKIEEKIPAGFEAKSMESRDGLFTFKDGVAKFVWMNLPDVPGFKVSYRLIPEASKTLDGLRIEGTLSYIQDGRNVSVDVIQQDIDLAGVNEGNIEAVLAALDKGEAIPVPRTEPEKEVVVKPPPPKEEKPVKEVEPVQKESKPAAGSGASRIPTAQLLPVYDGVYFRVQLAATKRFSDANKTYAKHGLSKPVMVEYSGAWYKYTAGSFSNYRQAQEFKNASIAKGIKGAFIVAYRNGKRIDIMDALQATGGK
ncbi:SPOR domain-containing protein [Bacteroidota bacterium]